MDKLNKVLSENELNTIDEDHSKKDKTDDQTAERRSNLIMLCQCGLLEKIGIKKTETHLKSAKDSEINKLFSEYQNRYTSYVNDELVNNFLFGYAKVCHFFCPRINEEKLGKELAENFIINSEIKKQIGRFSNWLTPWIAFGSVTVITAKSAVSTTPQIPSRPSDIPQAIDNPDSDNQQT